MHSLSLDFLFNRVYDVLLWIKYVFLFVLLREDKQQYLTDNESRVWDGLRDRGWLDVATSTPDMQSVVPAVDTKLSFWERVSSFFIGKPLDSDGDGISDIRDASPHDPNNLNPAQLKELFEPDYSFWDHTRDFFGFGPTDSDGDGVPNSYELAHGLNPKDADSDHDGLSDGEELRIGTLPLKSDTDHDGVMDSRDEAPLDSFFSSKGVDTDGDGVSDRVEGILGTDIHKVDTDGDGIPDGMDTYPLDATNTGTYPEVDVTPALDGLHFSIQNPILGFFVDLYSIIGLFLLLALVYVVFRWFLEFWKAQMHYEHLFGHGDHHDSHHGHEVSHGTTHHKEEHSVIEAGIPGLAVLEHEVAEPTLKEFAKHPRWAIIEGYMSADQEPLWRIGILEADMMLADALKEKGYEGEDVSDMLKSAGFATLQLAWDAHKVRNRIAHEGVSFVLTSHEAKRTFAMYEAVFKEMKLI